MARTCLQNDLLKSSRQRELEAAGLTGDTAARRAQDRGNWRDLVRALCVTHGHYKKRISK